MGERIRDDGRVAWAVVLAVHACLLGLLLSGRNPAPAAAGGEDASRLRVRWLPRETPPAPSIPLPSPAVPPARAAAAPVLPHRPLPTASPGAAEDASPVPPAGEGRLELQLPSAAPDFASRPLDSRQARLPGGEGGERFAMRAPISGERILQRIGLLFGGSSYETDPCPGIRKNLHGLLTDTSKQGRRALEIELEHERRLCRP